MERIFPYKTGVMKSRQLLQRKLFLLYERESVSPEIQQTLEQSEKLSSEDSK